jgi:hypothetical protein
LPIVRRVLFDKSRFRQARTMRRKRTGDHLTRWLLAGAAVALICECSGDVPARCSAAADCGVCMACINGSCLLDPYPSEPYCPDHNRIERLWLDVHANVTRHHRCKTIEELMLHVANFLRAYNRRAKLNPSLRPAIPIRESRSAV